MMEDIMKKKNVGTLFCILSAVFNVLAVVMFASGNESGTAPLWLCLGSSFLCLGIALSRKAEESEKKE